MKAYKSTVKTVTEEYECGRRRPVSQEVRTILPPASAEDDVRALVQYLVFRGVGVQDLEAETSSTSVLPRREGRPRVRSRENAGCVRGFCAHAAAFVSLRYSDSSVFPIREGSSAG